MAGMSDADWFCEQVEQLKPTMFRVAYSILRCEADCEDAAASAVLRAFRYLGTLRSREDFRAWLMRILKNECYTMLRKRPPTEPLTEREAYDQHMPDLDLAAAFQMLPPEARLALTLYHREGYAIREIARILGEPEGTVKSRLSRARATLRRTLEKGEQRA